MESEEMKERQIAANEVKRSAIIVSLGLAGLISLIACLCFISFASASVEDDFVVANKAYSEGNYSEAIKKYNEIWSKKGFSASLLFNLASAQYKSSNIGQAVLNYERAKLLDAWNPDIHANLAYIRKNTGLYEDENYKSAFSSYLSINMLGYLFIFSFALFSLSFFSYLFLKKPNVKNFILIPRFFLFFLMIFSALGLYQHTLMLNSVVVITPDAKLLVSPFASAEAIASPKEGKLFNTHEVFSDFISVSDKSGLKGWIAKNNVEMLGIS